MPVGGGMKCWRKGYWLSVMGRLSEKWGGRAYKLT